MTTPPKSKMIALMDEFIITNTTNEVNQANETKSRNMDENQDGFVLLNQRPILSQGSFYSFIKHFYINKSHFLDFNFETIEQP